MDSSQYQFILIAPDTTDNRLQKRLIYLQTTHWKVILLPRITQSMILAYYSGSTAIMLSVFTSMIVLIVANGKQVRKAELFRYGTLCVCQVVYLYEK